MQSGLSGKGECAVSKMSASETSFQEGQRIAGELMDALNAMGCDKDVIAGFIDQLGRTHRTLQQNYGRLLVASILCFAKMQDEGWYDLRNEALCQMCKKLEPIAKDTALPFV